MRRMLIVMVLAAFGTLVTAAPALAYSTSSVSAVAGTPLPNSTVVANFSDGYDVLGCGAASAYTGTVNWGDGSGPAAATVTGPTNPMLFQLCEYSVTAGHVYVLAGSYSLTVSVSGGGNPGAATGMVTVADPPITAGADGESSGVAGQSVSGVLGTFSTPNTLAPISYYSAVVAWGDNSSSAAVVSAGVSPGQLLVTAQHAYAVPSDYVATVTLTDGDGETSSLANYIAVADAPITAGSDAQSSGVAGQSVSGVLGTFSTPNTLAPISYYSAVVAWGDGSSSTAVVSSDGSPGQLSVTAQHAYAVPSDYVATVTLTDGDGETSSLANYIAVADAPITPGAGAELSGVAGQSVSGVLGTFSTPNTLAPISYYSAVVAWGDGSSSPALVRAGASPGQLSVTAAPHSYAVAGKYVPTVTLSDQAGDTSSLKGGITVADAPIAAGADGELSGVAGQSVSGVLGTFSTPNTLAPVSYYSATVAWGDGSSSAAVVSAGVSPGQLLVTAVPHSYAVAGKYVAEVTLSDKGGETSSLADDVDVSGPGLVAGPGLSLSGSEGRALSGTVAQFSTADTSASSSYYAATINWGDGRSSAGTVVAGTSPGRFMVNADHLYANAGTANAVVTVSDRSHESITVSDSVRIDLLTGQLSPAHASTIRAQPQTEFIGPVIDFGYAGGSAADLHATVKWGDGQTTGASVVELTASPIYGDLYEVASDHTYATAGTYGLTVTVRAANGKVLTVALTAVVAAQPSAHFPLRLRDLKFSPDSLAARLTCPDAEALCRGYLSASVRTRSGLTTLASSYFIVPGGRSAVIDLPIYIAQLKALKIRGRTPLELKAVVYDPTKGRQSTAQVTITHRFPG